MSLLIGAGWVNSDLYSLSQTHRAYKPLTPLHHHPNQLPRTPSTPHPHHSPLITHSDHSPSSLTPHHSHLLTHPSSLALLHSPLITHPLSLTHIIHHSKLSHLHSHLITHHSPLVSRHSCHSSLTLIVFPSSLTPHLSPLNTQQWLISHHWPLMHDLKLNWSCFTEC